MGLFRRSRKKRVEEDTQAAQRVATSTDVDPTRSPEETDTRAATDLPPVATPSVLNPTALRESLQELYAQRPSREVFVKQALQVFSRTGSIKAAAFLEYDVRGNRLALLGTVGLDQPAIDLISGDNRAQTWDIPLRV